MSFQDSYYGVQNDENDQVKKEGRNWSKTCTVMLNLIMLFISTCMLTIVWELYTIVSNVEISLEKSFQHVNITSMFDCFNLICRNI